VAPTQNFDEFFDQRHHRRVTINGEARINFGGCWHGCRIIDISGGGGRFRSTSKPGAGANVLVQLRGLGIVRGHVVHCESGSFSVQFNQEDYEPDALVDTLMLAANTHLLSRRDHLAATTSDVERALDAGDEEADADHKKKARGPGKLRRMFGG
jgi:hypothetical protein